MVAQNMALATAPVSESVSRVSRNRIVAFVTDDISAAALRTGFDGINQILDVKHGDIFNAIRLLEHDTELHSLIVDISNVDHPFDVLERLSQVCPADVRVAVIGDNTGIDFYRTIVRDIGVQEYLPTPLTRDTVVTKLRPKLVGDAQPVDRGGHVIAVCGAQGGAGATSIAVNLALQLAEMTKATVAIFDLHLQGGETAVLVNVQPGPGLRIALEDPERADTLFIERAAIEVNDRVKLIAADEDLGAELHITEAGVRHVIGLLRQRFNYIVVDVPVPLAPAIHPVIKLARHVLVLLEAEVTGLRNAHALRAAVTGIAGENRVFTVLNRADRPGGLPTSTIIKGLGGKPDMIIPELGKGMMQAINLGVPALHRVRGLRRYLAPIVREIASTGHERNRWWRFWR